MPGRHRPGLFGSRRLRAPLLAGAAAALIGVTAFAVRTVTAEAEGCGTGNSVRLTVAAAPAVTPAIQDVAARWSATRPQVAGECIRIEISPVEPAVVASRLAVRDGATLDVAASPVPTPREDDIPAVWIPDSISWVTRVLTVDRDVFDGDTPSVAMSPVVLAMNEPAARALVPPGQRLPLTRLGAALTAKHPPLKLVVADPRRDAASLAGAMVLRDVVVVGKADLPKLVGVYRTVGHGIPDQATLLKAFGDPKAAAPLSEQAVLAYDRGNPDTALTAVPLDPPAPAVDYPYAKVAGKSRAVSRAADLFRQALLAPANRGVFASYGFRLPDGSVAPGFPGGHGAIADRVATMRISDATKVSDVIGVWTAANTPSRVLALLDVTSSMTGFLGTAKGPRTRLDVERGAATGGLRMFTDDSRVGLWRFAGGIGGAKDWREAVPIRPLTRAQRAALDTAVARSTAAYTNSFDLYATVLDAYRSMRDGYVPGMSNTIVVFTDGRDDKPGAPSIDEVMTSLEKMVDVTRPVRVVVLGIGPDVDLTGLRQIAKATGGNAFQVDNPDEISQIFLAALLRVS